MLVKRAVEAVADRSQFPRCCVSVVVQILHNDGALSSAMLNCVSLALLDAGLPCHGTLAAAACALDADGGLLLDPTAEEELVRAFVEGERDRTYSLGLSMFTL